MGEAIEQEQQVLTMNPSEAQRLDTHALLAEAYFGAENFQEAIAHCPEYLRWRPDRRPCPHPSGHRSERHRGARGRYRGVSSGGGRRSRGG